MHVLHQTEAPTGRERSRIRRPDDYPVAPRWDERIGYNDCGTVFGGGRIFSQGEYGAAGKDYRGTCGSSAPGVEISGDWRGTGYEGSTQEANLEVNRVESQQIKPYGSFGC